MDRYSYFKGSQLDALYPQATVYCYLEIKIRCLKKMRQMITIMCVTYEQKNFKIQTFTLAVID